MLRGHGESREGLGRLLRACRGWLAVVAVATLATACRSPEFALTSTLPLAQSAYRYSTTPVSGRACVEWLLFIPLSLDRSYLTAKQRAIESSEEFADGLADGLVDVSVDSLIVAATPFYFLRCTIVTGLPFRFTEPEKLRSTPAPAAPAAPKGAAEPVPDAPDTPDATPPSPGTSDVKPLDHS